MSGRPILRDVADLAGCSTSTVSRVLLGHPNVNPATREAVVRAAQELGYRRNGMAESLRTGRLRLLGLLLADIANPTYPELAAGVIEAASAAGYHASIAHVGVDGRLQGNAIEALLEQACAGLILTSVVDADRARLEALQRHGVPFVQVLRRLEDFPADFVGVDEAAGGQALMRHVLSLGHRRICVVNGPRYSSASRGRLEGFRRALAEAGLELGPDALIEGDPTTESGYRATHALLAAGAEIDAIVCGNDAMALGAIDALLENGLRVPDDVGVAGYDDFAFASSRLIELTTIRTDRRALGRAAVSLLAARIADPARGPEQLLLPHQLIVRRTCGARVPDRRAAAGFPRTTLA